MKYYPVDVNEVADELVELWHTSDTRLGLAEFMKLTHDEYKAFVEEAVLPPDFLARHEQ